MKVYGQLAIFFAICLAGEGFVSLLPFSFPSSIASMLILLFLFACGLLRVETVEETANFFLHTMSFFFFPATVAILKAPQNTYQILLPLIFIGISTTIITFLAAAGATACVIHLQSYLRKEPSTHE